MNVLRIFFSQSVQILSLQRKEAAKKHKANRILKLIEQCKNHDGPVTASNLELLPILNTKQLLAEIRLLRCTVAPDVKERRKVTSDDGTVHYTTFPDYKLRESIRSILKPEVQSNITLDSLIFSIF